MEEIRTESREERRQKIKDKYQNASDDDLIFIPAKKQIEHPKDAPKKRACAYCRVSTDDPAQTTSYELQKEHYEEQINSNPQWVFAGIYADEGISATSMKHRDNFNRMIADCKQGKIDVIITKAVSRFARNIVDCLSVVRQLSDLNPPVAVVFETEGINTLDSTSEMILAVMAAAAQEESKTKSNSMNWSLEKRFKKGNFLTPVLLGYDHDEDGNLIVNEDEAQTVKLMYYMFLAGFPLSEIAQVLTELGRQSKLGNTHWTAAGVRSILENERYCGNVLSWKTYTYNFWEHKKRKNNQEKPQVLKVDHHEAIVSHEIYDAAILKLTAEKYIKKGIPLPALSVVLDGILTGYVPVNRLWTGFSGDDYEKACKSAYDNNENNSNVLDDSYSRNQDEFILDGYKIVRSQFFSLNSKPTLTIERGHLRFNSICLKKFENVEYVELLINSVEQCIAVRPCSSENPNAIRWGRLKDSKWVATAKSCVGFAGPLFNMMSWESDCGYKLCGQYLQDGEDQVLIFDLSDPLITKFEAIENDIDAYEETDNSDSDETSNVNNCMENAKEIADKPIRLSRSVVVPDFDSTARQRHSNTWFCLNTVRYKDNWNIMIPASVYAISGNVSQETMRRVNIEASELLRNLREKEGLEV